MLTIQKTTRFKKDFRLALKRGCSPKLFEYVLTEIANQRPLPAKYQDHELSGNWNGFRECHIQPDWLLIYLLEDNLLTLTLVRTGSHTDLFDK
jgi:mRNA interferase YafQ